MYNSFFNTFSKVLRGFLILIFILAILSPSTATGQTLDQNSIITDYNDKNSIVKNIVIRKNKEDGNQSGYVFKSSLPFTIEVFLKDSAKDFFSDFHALILFKSSFSSPYKSSFEYNSLTNSFLLENIVFDGLSNVFFFAISDGTVSYYKEFLIPIPNAVLSGQTPDDQGGLIPEGSSGKISETTKKDESEKVPASLKPHLILNSHKIVFSKTDSLSFNLTLEFYNTSNSLTAENIVINFVPNKYDTSSMKLYLNNSDSNKYIEKIPPKGKSKVDLSFSINKDMDIAVYLLDITTDFQYIDKKDENPISTSDKSVLTINPTVSGNLRIDFLHIPEDIIIKENFEIEYRIANTGFSPLSNVDIIIVDAENKRVATLFLGKILPNESADSPNIKLNIKKAGKFSLKLIVSYLDERNLEHKIEKDFTINVKEALEVATLEEDLDNPTIIIEKQESRFGSGWIGGFLLSSVILFILFGITQIIKKNRSNNTSDLTDNLEIKKTGDIKKTSDLKNSKNSTGNTK